MDNNENARESLSQCSMILERLKTYGSITQLDAAQEPIYCLRLSARIKDLKDRGHKIGKQMITVPSGKRVAKYFLES